MNPRISFGLLLALNLGLMACDNTTNNAPKNVVNQTTNSAPQVVNNTTIINQTASAAPTTAPKASASPEATPSATPVPSATPATSCGKLDIRADGTWHFPRPDKTERILKPGEYQLFPDGSAKITKAGEPDTGAIIKPPACTAASAAPVVTQSPTPAPSAPSTCKLDIRADGSWYFPRPDKTARILKKGEYQLFPDGSAKITKPGEPDTGAIIKPSC